MGSKNPLPYELLHHAFEARAQTMPDRHAIEFGNNWLSFGEVNSQASTLASMIASLNIPAKSRVAVVMDRCLEFPIGLLAALKVGATFMPLDVSFPAARISYMLSDANVQAVLTTEKHRAFVDGLNLSIPVVVSDSKQLASMPQALQLAQESLVTRHDEAYVVYTSGSTGKPKGVPVFHGGVVNAISFRSSDMGFVEGSRVMQFMAIGFDACQLEIWSTLSHGATLVLRSGDDLGTFSDVDVVVVTPTALAILGDPLNFPNLKCVCVGGEAIPASLKNLWCDHVRLFNCYGPTEGSILTHLEELTLNSIVTIGLPIDNVNCYILDETMNVVPIGVAGEIYLSGFCVASHYINLPTLTSERFLDDPVGGGRMYRTGDFGIMLPCGKIQILGRSDSQVKLKGYRIELEEIAEAMMHHPGVVTAAVIVKDKTHLVGFFTPPNVNVESLQNTVSARVPVYMVPAVWLGINTMPLSVNGKIDKKELEKMDVKVHVEKLISNSELQMAFLWAQVLGVDVGDIGRRSSFFALGGDSISAIRLVSKAKTLGYLLTTALILKNPMLSNMVGVAKTIETSRLISTSINVCGDFPLTPIQCLNFDHPWKNVHFWNQSVLLKPKRELGLDELRDCVARLVTRHDMLRGRFRYSKQDGWSQYVLPVTENFTLNVEYLMLENTCMLDTSVLAKEKSLNLIHGPVYAVTLFGLPENTQCLHIAIHHTLVDLVSYRVLIDELQSLLYQLSLGPKTTSFLAWSQRLASKAKQCNPTLWAPYMMDDVLPPASNRSSKISLSGVLRREIAANLDSANAKYGTNIQELALSALTVAYAELTSPCNLESIMLPLMLEGHGRESWLLSETIDVSNTVGWFTCLFPIVCTSTCKISNLIRQIKQTIRGVPHGGISSSSDSLFETVRDVQDVVGPDEEDYIPGNIYLHHEGQDLVMDVSVAQWQLSSADVEKWISLWCEWMKRIVDHCLDPETIGGRTVSDVPLVGTSLEMIEAELVSTFGLHPFDVEDIYPVTPMQAGMLLATSQDPSEYVLQSTFDLLGDIDFFTFQQLWKRFAKEEPLLRTLVVSTSDGFFQAVANADYSEWTMIEGEGWPINELELKTLDYYDKDRARGFHLKSKSYVRFAGFRLSEKVFRFQEGQEHIDSPIGVDVIPQNGQYLIVVSHDCRNIGNDVMKLLCERFSANISNMANKQNLHQSIMVFDKSSDFEKQIVQESSFGSNISLKNELLHHAFEERAASLPDIRAVEIENEWLSYGELNDRAHALAYELASLGICVGSRVAVIMERCLEFPIGLLAVLKVGATMVPLDASFPINRLAYMLCDSGVSVIISIRKFDAVLQALQPGSIVYVEGSASSFTPRVFESSLCHQAKQNSEAFVVYTSGSTGKPKGVPVLHGGAVNCIENTVADAKITEGMRVMQFMAIGFDACQWEIWKALSFGATLVFRGQNMIDSLLNVDMLTCTPTALAHLGNPCKFPRLKCVAVGGEILPGHLKDIWSPCVNLMNSYGPTECSMLTHYLKMDKASAVTVGKPIPNVNSYVLDKHVRPVPVGVVGELYLGGICVSSGYINQSEQTAERFLQDPFSNDGGKMFRTGDLARILPNGHFEILGRQDSQVKLKGYRIELDEVAGAMMDHPRVVAAAAIVKNKTLLVGYFTPDNIDISELRNVVASHLPVYMVPVVWVGLHEMPQNVNGKIDKKSLEFMDVEMATEELKTDTEKRMAAVWAQVLDIDVSVIGRNTSFFSLGGDSISSVKIVAACKNINLVISVGQLMKAATLEALAAVATDREEIKYPTLKLSREIIDAATSSFPTMLGSEYVVYPVTPEQSYMLSKTAENPQAWQLQSVLPISKGMNVSAFCDAFKTVVARHEILRTAFTMVKSKIYQVIPSRASAIEILMAEAATLSDYLALDWTHGFHFGDTCWIRLAIVADYMNQSHAVMTIHHALYDGWSFSMINADILNAYNNYPHVIRPPFRRVIEFMDATKYIDREFWALYLDGVSNSTHFHEIISIHADVVPCENLLHLETTLSIVRLAKYATDMNVSLSALLQFAWASTLRQYSHKDVIVFCQEVSNRALPIDGVDRIIGPLINCVPCRVIFDTCLSVRTLLQRYQFETSATFAHSFASLKDIKSSCGLENLLSESCFMFQNFPVTTIEDGFVAVETLNYDLKCRQPQARDDTFSFYIILEPKTTTGLQLSCDFDPKKFTTAQAQEILTTYEHTLASITGEIRETCIVV
ncbi:Aste57867_9274 [Aphanomyces stellatus]|uniref:Aste57867_9274 protein n=1 Tax=Aphanomyces stellatus TaxID=120398 RepID=A0A485KMS7_9STRA|nr:hypothetical protein As57867_009238 [Aphanomyces stellatus]VFT86157.1 Aste57867_9274 [Aphanomyces stellatus]